MATMVCHGLQTCLESPIVESRTLRLRLSSPKPHFSQSLELALKPSLLDSNTKELSDKCHCEETSEKANVFHDKHTPSNPDMGGWSFLEALSTTLEGRKELMGNENTYVHPLFKRSSSMLSERSLELCTESLGSETGTDIIENGIFLLSSSESPVGNSPTRKEQKSRQLLGAKKANSRSFPPPLTTMSGSKSLRVRTHREDGRLIMKAIKTPSTGACLQAERSHGRLRLCFVKDSTYDFDSIGVASKEENEGNNIEDEIENDTSYDEAEEVEEGTNAYLDEEEAESNDLDVDADEMGMQGFQRPGRCKEDEMEKKGLLNWEPFLVATS